MNTVETFEGRTRVLYVDDETANLELFQRLFASVIDIYCATNTNEAREILKKHEIHLIISDQRMPGENGLDFLTSLSQDHPECAKIILTAYGDRHVIRNAFQTHQIMDFIWKPFDRADLLEVFRKGRKTYEENFKRLRKEQTYEDALHQVNGERVNLVELIGADQGLREVAAKIGKIASADSRANVLLRGESGTGKELLARAIHALSGRANEPFIAINCPAIPENLWESELFGHEKGAFTQADKRKLGRFELAHGGTIFLDEITEIPAHLQTKLLRVLQERSFERVGGTQTIHVNVRIIAATNRNLEAAVASGVFREDLYYRLNVIPLLLPPLRERREDIPSLLRHFLAKFNRLAGKACWIEPETLLELQKYAWPGNVRELENLVQRAIILADHDILRINDFLVDIGEGFSASPTPKTFSTDSSPYFLEEIKKDEHERYKSALRQAKGNITRAAQSLGIKRRTLSYRLKRANLT